MSQSLSHLDDQGRAQMVDVSGKADTRRTAIAEGCVRMLPETVALIQTGGVSKGDVLTVAKIAGIMAAKRTAELIPMCHPLPLTDVRVELETHADRVTIRATASTVGKTGVEMEALTAVSVAGLTVYDMCKAADKTMVVDAIRLTHKSGGKSDWNAPTPSADSAVSSHPE